MRRLALALLMLNILYALWTGLRPAPGLSGDTSARQFPDTLVLIGELDRPLVAVEQTPAYCLALGPFGSEGEVQAFADAYLSGQQWRLAVEEQPLPPLSRVYVSSSGSELVGSALLTSVRDTINAAGLAIDSYLVVGGDLDGVVSLGLFADQGNALGVYQQIEGLDLAVEMQAENRTRNLYSIVLTGDESADFTEESAEAWASMDVEVGITEKLCEMIALPD
ncbi:MAG: hypothetical protein CMQ34_13335 [Gammaproteobacteria bacterium]|nr:hypothetical protein [Gammaproteobacteria bacterium]|tara:strand:+ start:1228 stop:1893 length:666 start_codon:yes stop_codon:yes gene_type:complete